MFKRLAILRAPNCAKYSFHLSLATTATDTCARLWISYVSKLLEINAACNSQPDIQK